MGKVNHTTVVLMRKELQEGGEGDVKENTDLEVLIVTTQL